ncbi:MAG: phage major capsid protein [Thiobacillus sp.]|uniref:phage major capsid protein n=1 Tax=Thiobacillus sp. TaxID=924 RepID=UPI002893A224|nr:phage major capsid protein [Thiobacillus sp.]MDT3708163.1 phage major capsid protein [Thiobacillus sp.]
MTQEPTRQRIDGNLSRSLPATLTIRAPDAAESDQPADTLLRLRLSVSSEEPYLRSSWWDEPWIEVLGHKKNEINLDRLNGGAAVLANHDRVTAVGDTPLASIGVVEKAWIEGNRLMADLIISRREALADLRLDIADGLIRNVSIGYQIGERVLTKTNGDGQADEYRVTNWTPFEISLVDIPADATVGLGRQAPEQDSPRYRVVDLPNPGAAGSTSVSLKGKTMSEIITDPAPVTAPVATRSIEVMPGSDPLAAERERMKEIRAIGRQHNMADLADRAIDAGTSVDAFRAQALQRLTDAGVLRPAESPEIGMSRKDVEQFSFCRVMLAAADPMNAARIAPFEMEASRAAQDRRGDSRKDREHAITVPADVLSRAMALSPEMLSSAQRMLMAQRDLTVGAPTGGGNLVATDLLGASFIDLLRNAMVLDRLGITWLRDLNGNIAIPSQSGAATGYWVAENGAPTESQQTVGQVTLTPKTVGAFTDFSRRLLLQSSLDVEAFVRADLAATLGQMLQAAAINGSGASNEPRGILNTSGIGAVVGGTNGLAPAYTHMVDLESAVANANADMGNLAYLTNTKVRGTLRKTQEFATTNGKPVWTSGGQAGVGDVLGYQALTSNSVPSNLTQGTSVGVCSAMIFGNWSELIIGMWGGLDIMLDPYTGSSAGTKRVVALQDVDVALRRAASFGAFKDILTA